MHEHSVRSEGLVGKIRVRSIAQLLRAAPAAYSNGDRVFTERKRRLHELKSE